MIVYQTNQRTAVNWEQQKSSFRYCFKYFIFSSLFIDRTRKLILDQTEHDDRQLQAEEIKILILLKH